MIKLSENGTGTPHPAVPGRGVARGATPDSPQPSAVRKTADRTRCGARRNTPDT